MTETNPPRRPSIRLFHDLREVPSLDLNAVDARSLHEIQTCVESWDLLAPPGRRLSINVHTSSNSDRAWDAKPKACVDAAYTTSVQGRPLVHSASLRTTATMISALLTVLQTDSFFS